MIITIFRKQEAGVVGGLQKVGAERFTGRTPTPGPSLGIQPSDFLQHQIHFLNPNFSSPPENLF